VKREAQVTKILPGIPIMVLVTIMISNNLAFGQDMKPGQESISFVPVVPTENSNIETSIRVSSLDLYCLNYALEYSISNHQLIFNIKTKSNPEEKCPPPTESDIFLSENIGQLDFGAYDVKLLLNGTQKVGTKLYVSQSDIEITATGSYMDQDENFHIVGEAKNTGNFPLKLIQLDVSFVDGEQVLADNKIYTTMAILLPGKSSGFDLLVQREDLVNKQYFVRVSSYLKDTLPIPQGLKLVGDSSWQSSSGTGIVSGSVFNYAQSDATQVKVVCVLYDKTKTSVLDSLFDYTNPTTIRAGQSGSFTLVSHYQIPSGFIQDCNVESPDVTMVLDQSIPEFPQSIPILLIGITSIIAFYKIKIGK
jgi:hypothetical protein